MKLKKIFVILLSTISVLLLSSCNTNKVINTWDEIAKRGYFIVGLDDTFAPMGFRDDNGLLVGFDVDLANEVAKRLGVEVRFQPIDWDAKVLELNAGTIDMIWNGLTITDSRLEEMSFSSPYLTNRQIIIVNADSKINYISDLTNLQVGVQVSSAAQEAVEANAIYPSLGALLTYDSYNQALLELNNNVIDAVIIDEIVGRYIIKQTGNDIYRVTIENFGEEQYGVGFRLEATDIRDKINQTLQEMIDDGTASAISITWFGEDIFLK